MIDHQNTIQHCHTKEGDKPDSRRYTERQATQPESHDTTDERQRHRREHHQRINDTPESKEQQEQNQQQGNRDDHHQGTDRVLQVLKLTTVFEIISRFQLDVLIQRFPDLGYDLLDIGIAHIDADHDTPLGGIPIDL